MTNSHQDRKTLRKVKAACLRVLSLLCLFGFLWQGIQFFQLYYSYPTTVEIKIGHEDTLEFPAVTLCHTNRFRKSFAQERWPEVFWDNSTYGNKMGLAWELMSGKNNLYQNLTLKEQIEAGHHSNNMVPQARFERKPVTWKLSPFYRPNTFLYGVCYTWTQEEQRKKGFHQFQFWAIVNLEPEEVLADKVEVKLVVHHKNYIPEFTTANGVLLEPGKDYELKLKQSTAETLSTPYGEECHNQNQLGMDKLICIEGCTQKELIDQCKCFATHIKSNGVPVNSSSARPCGRYDTESYKCQKTVEKNKDKISPCEAKCVHPCRIVNYDITTTVKDPWPEDTAPKEKKNLESVFNVWSDSTRRKAGISTLEKERKSLARVLIYFSSMTHVTYKQFPKFEDIEVFSYIGGYLGMWLGVSLLNCLDILDGLLVRLKKYKNKEVKTTEQQYSDKVSCVAVHSVSENY